MSLTPKILTFAVTMALAGTALAGNPVADHARQLLRQSPAAAQAAANDQFVERDVIRDPSGAEHVRFNRTYGGLEVIGGDFVVHSAGGALRGVSKTLNTTFRPGTRPSLSSDTAIDIAGTGRADAGSMRAAIALALSLAQRSQPR